MDLASKIFKEQYDMQDLRAEFDYYKAEYEREQEIQRRISNKPEWF